MPCFEGNTSGTKYFYIEGVCWAAYCNNGAVVWLALQVLAVLEAANQRSSVSGFRNLRTVQQDRCSNADWSYWSDGVKGGECPAPSCSSSECWNGAFCEKSTSNYNSECQKYCVYCTGWKLTKESYKGEYSSITDLGRNTAFPESAQAQSMNLPVIRTLALAAAGIFWKTAIILPGLCKKQPFGFYVLANWECEDSFWGYVGLPNSSASSGVTRLYCNSDAKSRKRHCKSVLSNFKLLIYKN